jgi:hypothetical protein
VSSISCSVASMEETVAEARVLLESLRLLAEVRGLHILPQPLAQILHEAIWAISVRPLFRPVRVESVAGFLRIDRMTLPKLRALVACGEGILAARVGTRASSSSSSSAACAEALRQAKKLLEMAALATRRAAECCSREDALKVMQSIGTVWRHVKIDDEFYFARILCFLRPQKVKKSEESEVREQEVYCWCRGGDHGAPMICCDICDEWFHNRCVHVGVKKRAVKGTKRTTLSRGEEKSEEKVRKKVQKVEKEEGTKVAVVVVAADQPFTSSSSSAIENELDRTRGEHEREQEELQDLGNATFMCISCSAAQKVKYKYAW